ncbi:acyl-CoA N-acyltransferase [Lophiostoma macrostomum CBS 122681]|uniref:Acyl-CoA N-acyltransferase n=1 Tax=Lophiostoma macrostomum CBS 122681 TaxID=1314788 RepID=A0A6A6TMS0_9PLEO|nr:acyl-CoA N-acyltransferase [Lophiostoma macrostomum CBS 122681]
MGTEQVEQRRRFEPGEVVISEVTKDDLQSLAEGYYESFPKGWFDSIEPAHLRPEDESIRAKRFAIRMTPWLSEPHTRWTKATLHPSSPEYDPSAPNRVIGHAGWLLPGRTAAETLNFWRKDASDDLGWCEKMGWTEKYEDELWSGTDVNKYQEQTFLPWDRVRAGYMNSTGHWFLAPLWVLPEHQRRGVASLLLRDGTERADQQDPVPPMYLEAMKDARPIYEHFGFQGVEGDGADFVMIRTPPANVKPLGQK